MIAQYLYSQDKDIFLLIMSDFPDLFRDLPCHVVKHQKINHIEYEGSKFPVSKISYCGRKYKDHTNQFQDVCIAADVPTDIPYKLEWTLKNQNIKDDINKLNTKNKPICLVTAPFKPFGRDDDWGKEMTVDFTCMDRLITEKKDDYFFIQTCKDDPIYKLKNIDFNLSKKTTVSDLIDIASLSSVLIGQVGHCLPLAECLDKPALIFFSANGLKCGNKFLEAITPTKTIYKKSMVKYVIDNWSEAKIRTEFEGLNIK
jgi:hypothetical protein